MDVEHDVAVRERLGRLAAAALERTHACEQFLGGERLDEVVVGACVEPGDAVGHAVAGGQQQDGEGEAFPPQAPTDGRPVQAGHGDVEDDEVRHRAFHRRERCAAVRRRLHFVSLGRQRPCQHAQDRRVVVDHENRGHASDCSSATRT